MRGATEGINLVAQSWGRRNIERRRRDRHHLPRAPREHRAVAAAVRREGRAAARRARRRPRPGHPRGVREAARPADASSSRSPQVSNALGTITPAREMVEMAHRHGARVLVDGAQAVSHMRVDVQALDCDFYVFSGHKVFAPDRHRRGLRQARRARRDAAVAGRRQHDRRTSRSSGRPTSRRRRGSRPAPATSPTRSGLGAALDYADAHRHRRTSTATSTSCSSTRPSGSAPSPACA